jgi:hypothetical protein
MKKRTLLSRRNLTLGVLFLVIAASITPGINGEIQTVAQDGRKPDGGKSRPGDTTPPDIILNFAGNPGDDGGPYWRPTNESVPLQGPWANGYYTNDSRQFEHWMYINATIHDASPGVDTVFLHWLNETTWTNTSYQLTHTAGDYWEFNSTGIINDIAPRYNYSFDIWANDTLHNSKLLQWKKTVGTGPLNRGGSTRRYIQLGCSPESIDYSSRNVFYFHTATYTACDMHDRLHHDQGGDGTAHDTGYLLRTMLTDSVSHQWCDCFTG